MQPLPLPSSSASVEPHLHPTSYFAHPNQPSSSDIAYTSPTSPDYKLTSAELNALRNGRLNARGDMVFFKPGFIDENPWKALQEQEVARVDRVVRNEG